MRDENQSLQRSEFRALKLILIAIFGLFGAYLAAVPF